jgi:cytochrome c553
MRYSKQRPSIRDIRRSPRGFLREFWRLPHSMKRIGKALALVIAISALPVHAKDEVAREWAAGCLSCHQPSARALPPLQGQSRDALLAKLRAFRDGTRPGTVMPQIAHGYTDGQIDAIAGWFSAERPPARP